MPRPTSSIARWLTALIPALGACGGGSEPGPTGNDPTRPSRVAIAPATVVLDLGETAILEATVYDGNNAVTSTPVSWSSSAPDIASVSSGGMVTATSGGTARITASAGTVSGSVTITVNPWKIADNAVVIDSTVLQLAGSDEERAQGTYRFTATGSPPAMAVGDVIVGAQSGGFLRRVTAVSVSGPDVVAETETASLSDIIIEGSLETVIQNLALEGGVDTGAGLPGNVRWGAPMIHSLPEGVTANATGGFDLSGFDICKELKKAGGPNCPSGITTLEVKTGTLDFGPQFDLNASFSGLSLKSFRGVAKGTVSADFDILLEAKTSATIISPQVKIAGVTRPFYGQIGPIPVLGYVELALKGGLEATATAKGKIQAGFTSSHTIEVGADWMDGAGWTPVFTNQRLFDAREPSLEDGTLSGQIDVTTKLFLKPEIKIIFYGVVGPFLNVEPYAKFTMTFGTSSCGMDSSAGIDSEIGFTIPFLDPKAGTVSKKNSPWFLWQGKSWTCPLGTLDVSTITNGTSPDPDGYTIVVDTVSKGTVQSTGQHIVSFVEVGDRTVLLEGVASNCTVTSANPVTVKVSTGVVSPVAFQIDCQTPGGDLAVNVTTTGALPDPDGYTLTVDGTHAMHVDPNGTATFTGLAQGDHQVVLSGLAANCLLLGANPQTITVTAAGTVNVAFTVNCAASQLVAATSTQGPPATTNWTMTLDGGDTRPIQPNDQVTFDLADGPHTLLLGNVAANCTVQGANPRNVTVATSAQETFNVSCDGGGLSVTVATTGDPSPATTYTVAADTSTKTVPVNGSVNFSNLPAIPAFVELRDLPTNCLVQGENPRLVNVPGATTFDVLCQAPLSCLNPPAAMLDGFLFEDWDKADPKPILMNTVTAKDYGIADVMAMAFGTVSGFGTVELQAEWKDQLMLLPVDAGRVGETVKLMYEGSYVLHTEIGLADSLSHASATGWLPGKTYGIDRSIHHADPDITTTDTISVSAKLGQWFQFNGGANVFTTGHNQKDASARTKVQVSKLLKVEDLGHNEVSILQVCSASGKEYPK